MKSGIYLIVSPLNEAYIGSSSNLKARYNSYKNCKTSRPIDQSIICFGFDAHSFDVIEECDENELGIKEEFYINYFRFLGFKMLNVNGVCVGIQTPIIDEKNRVCPLCMGAKEVEKIIPIDDARTFAKKLREHGYSWRQIADAMGYKSHNAAKYLVESK